MSQIPQNAYALVLIGLGVFACALKMPDWICHDLIGAGLLTFNTQTKSAMP